MNNIFLSGDWNVICDSCGRKYKASQLRKRWDGLMVCEKDWETRHPQDLIQVQQEKITVDWARPEATDTFLQVGDGLITEQSDTIYGDYDYILTEEGQYLETET